MIIQDIWVNACDKMSKHNNTSDFKKAVGVLSAHENSLDCCACTGCGAGWSCNLMSIYCK